jgi:hypothetical protein
MSKEALLPASLCCLADYRQRDRSEAATSSDHKSASTKLKSINVTGEAYIYAAALLATRLANYFGVKSFLLQGDSLIVIQAINKISSLADWRIEAYIRGNSFTEPYVQLVYFQKMYVYL